MTCYKIVVAYDGSAYHGWQSQPDVKTICSVLEEAFEKAFFTKAFILGASRTDAGVHALGQVAIVQTSITIKTDNLLRAWSKLLPLDILIKDIKLLDRLVHPHDGVVQKTYHYYFFTERPLPLYQRFGWYFKRKINFDILNQALDLFVGTHDFRSFCSGNDHVTTIRTIDSVQISFVSEWNAFRIEIKGKSFLRYMIRRVVGACLEVASRDCLCLDDLKNIFLKKNPCHTLPNSPAKGLLLYQILYETQGGLK